MSENRSCTEHVHCCRQRTVNFANDERGAMLIIVLVTLLLLSILGATVLTSTTSELRVSGNYRNMQEAFFNADGSLEHALVNSDILSDADWTGFVYMLNGFPVAATALPLNTVAVAAVNADYLGEGKAPRGSGYDESTVANYYDVNVVGRGPDTGQNNTAEAIVDAGLVRFR